ncbi:MAG: MarR family winged helix-turn-helix transcriptional regulator [Pseudomonadota bacterium]
MTDARAVTETCAGTNMRLAARRITRFLETRMQGAGLSLAQFALMSHIAAARDDTIAALADRMELDQSTLSRNLRGLEKAGLVELVLVERDLRRRAVWLTEKGARQLEAAMPAWRTAHEALSEVVSPQAMAGLVASTAVLAELEDGKVAVNQ